MLNKNRTTKNVSLQFAIEKIQSNQRLFIHGAAATPTPLIAELIRQSDRLLNVEIIHMHTEGPATYGQAEFHQHFKVAQLFVGHNLRKYLDYKFVDYIPSFLSEMPEIFRQGLRPIDIALIHISPPDEKGFCSLGTSVDTTVAAIETAKIVLAIQNPQMPYTFGDAQISISNIDYLVEDQFPIHQVQSREMDSTAELIGKNVAELVEDGATLQMGIGAIPDAVMRSLKGHKNLGIHTEMWSDGTLDLVFSGAVTNSQKRIFPGKLVSTFLMGTQRLYDFINKNPDVIQLESSYVNNPMIIAQNKKVTAINSAVEIDLTGQVCADSIGSKIISGVGGQIDFISGANHSERGKPIIAINSRTKNGQARIVPMLHAGAGVVTTRAHVHYVVTEYGTAQLFGKTLNERAYALMNIAHPDDRENLERSWFAITR